MSRDDEALDRDDRPGQGRVERVRAEDAERRLEFLTRASTALASSLDYAETLEALARLVVETFADIRAIDVLEGDAIRRVAVVHREPSRQEVADRMREFPPNLDADSVVPRVLRTGIPEVESTLSEAEISGMDHEDERRALFRALGVVSRMCVPLTARGRVLGTILLLSVEPDRHYDEHDLDLVADLAKRAALAVDNARLHEDAQHAVALKEESLSLLDTLLATAPVGLGFVDRQLRYVRINDSLAAMTAATAEAHLGRTVREMLPDLADIVEPLYRQVLETGKPVLDVEVTGETPARPGLKGAWVSSYYPVRGPRGDVTGVGDVVADISERKNTEDELRTVRAELTDQLEDLTKLLQLSGRLSTSLELQPVLEEVLTSVISVQGADAGVLRLYEPETDELVAAAHFGVGEDYLRALGRVPARAGVWGRAFADRRPFISEDVGTDPAFDGFSEPVRAGGYRAVYTSPLITRRGEIIGTIATHFREPRKPTDREERLIELRTLTEPGLRNAIEAAGIALVGYGPSW